ncbi:hypothetical protein MPL3365_150201 [Mesorhizobium plurifarium]|uniref:Uncharacterized protein n=1 Tax=Mesorhizobium plurifarium TaxID=69974 RepID=A0A090GTA1_MESPL|nr:hypothetical protein MPL3365_150201 [Mesorhizobium plurifarium]
MRAVPRRASGAARPVAGQALHASRAELQGPAGKRPPLPRRSRQSVSGDRRRSGRTRGDRLGRLWRAGDLRHRQGRQDRLQACRAADARLREGFAAAADRESAGGAGLRRRSPSSGRFAAIFSPRGEEVGAGAYLLLSPWGEVGLPRIAFAIRLAIRVRVCRSAVDLLVDLVEHLGTVGAQIGEIAAGQVLDFGDETVVVAALGDAGAGTGDKIVEHDRVPFMPH